MTEIKQPKIRFKGYIDNWEQCKLKDVSEMYDNLRVPITASDRVAGDTPYYGANGIQDYVEGYTHNGEYVLIAEDGANDLLNYPVNYVNDKVWINNHAHVVSGKLGELNNLFLVSRIKSMNIVPWLVGGGRAKLNGDVLKKLPILIPIFEEQVKIGNFFKHLDDTIALHQQKLEVTKQFKQTMLKKMFPKNGETTPEIRFKGFTDDWEDEKFLDICSVKKGTQLNKDTLSKEKTETYKYPVYNGSVNPIGYTTESNKEKGLIMTEGGDVGRVLFSETPFWSSGHSYNITSVDNNIYYLQYLFESNYRKINSKGLGVTIKNLSLSSLKQIILTVNSSYQEQELIGNYFKKLDNQIKALEKKLELYKEFKKAMLQKMFI